MNEVKENENKEIINETKKTKSSVGIIILLVLCLIGTTGYIVYDKVINKENQEIENKEPILDESKNESKEPIQNVEQVVTPDNTNKEETVEKDNEDNKYIDIYSTDFVKNKFNEYIMNRNDNSFSDIERIDVANINYDYGHKRYVVNFNYLCKEGKDDCIYFSQKTSKISGTACFEILNDKITSFNTNCITTGPTMIPIDVFNKYYLN